MFQSDLCTSEPIKPLSLCACYFLCLGCPFPCLFTPDSTKSLKTQLSYQILQDTFPACPQQPTLKEFSSFGPVNATDKTTLYNLLPCIVISVYGCLSLGI